MVCPNKFVAKPGIFIEEQTSVNFGCYGFAPLPLGWGFLKT
jgi:hypothetical protein